MCRIDSIDSFLDENEENKKLYENCSLNWNDHVGIAEQYVDIAGDAASNPGWDVGFSKSKDILIFDDSSQKNILIKGLLSDFKSESQNFAKAVRSRFVQAWGKKWRDEGEKFPLLIQVQRNKFENLPDDTQKIQGSQKTKRTLKHNLEKPFSFLSNSSIWVRLVDNKDTKEQEIAEQEFGYFKEIGLYDYPTAKEYLDYNIRLQENNYLNDFGNNHGNYVTPLLYGNEVRARDVLKNNYATLHDSKITSVSKPDFKYLEEFHDIALRILLIDDKIGPAETNKTNEIIDATDGKKLKIEIKECDDCSTCKNKQCKLRTIKHLMDDGKKDNDKKSKIFERLGGNKDYFYWKEEGIESYYCPSVTCDFIDNEQQNDISNTDIQLFQMKDGNELSFELKIDYDNLNIQIVGVRDVRTALILMSKYKFDMVFCDYLLEKKDKNPQERDYANQLFKFLSHDYKEDIKKNPSNGRLIALGKLQREVLYNRGPLDKFWIMPITGFNETFISDLYRTHTNLIDYKWNISNGADPINTPWQFLYHLNCFLELQLKSCYYRRDQLLRFLLYTCEELKKRNNMRFHDFQAFMGSEYANFMRRYGNRQIIQRDAYKEKDKDKASKKSLFATYIWKQFYIKPEYRNRIELNRLIHSFFHQAATMRNDRRGQQRLEETFGQLCFFIDTNQKVRDVIGQEEDLNDNKLYNALKGLREKMDMLTSNRHDDGSNNKNK